MWEHSPHNLIKIKHSSYQTSIISFYCAQNISMTEVQAETGIPTPIPAEAPLPHRKVIRQWLKPITGRTTPIAVVLLLMDWVVFAALIAGTILLEAWWAKLLCS